MATRQERIDALNESIDESKIEKEFLTDSGVFYELDLGEGNKTVLVTDLAATDGIKQTTATNESKLDASWYQNYAGFTTAQEDLAIETFNRLRAYLKLQRIHEWLYPAGIDRAATGDDVFKWVVSYDPIGDSFVPKNVGDNVGVDAPAQYEALFYFKGTPADNVANSADCQQAIDLMMDSETGSDQMLRDLFGKVI